MRNTPKIGTPVKAELNRNCLVCNRYTACSDPSKSARFACSKFKENQHFDINDLFDSLETDKRAPTEDELFLDNQLETDYVSKLDEILNSGLPVVPDLRYDDKHMPRAKNVFEWMTKKKFLGLTEIKPYAKQLQLVCHIQSDWCPHCSNEDFFEDFPLHATYDDIRENMTFLEHGKCPKCEVTKTDLLYGGSNVKVENYMDPFGTFTVAGQRSGKSIIVAMGESYTYHNFLMTPSVHRTFGIMSATPLVATYVALTFAQAKSALWEPIAGFIADSPWFREYHKWLDDLGRKNGEELYTFSETMLRYKHKNMLTTVASPNKRTLRGKTSFSAAVDELGLFPVGKTKSGHDQERADGKEVIKSLQNSMATLRGAYISKMKQGYYRVPKPTLSAVSSPFSLNDYIMYHYNLHLGGKTYYCFKSSTWDFNPTMPREALDAEFRADPIAAERDFGANPPMTANAYLPKEKEVFELFDGKSNRISLSPRRIKTKKKKILTCGDIKKIHDWDSLIYGNTIMAIDAGYNNNSFAFAIGGLSSEDPNDPFKTIAIGEIIPNKEYPISFNALYTKVLVPLVEEFNVCYLASDRWQNIKLMQDLEEECDTAFEEYRLKKADFDAYKDDLKEGLISFPKTEMTFDEIIKSTADDYPSCFLNKPASHLFYQHITVQDTGNTVVKGAATDDIFRCCVMLGTMRKWDYVEEAMFDTTDIHVPKKNVIGIVAGLTRGISGGQPSGKSTVLGVRRSLSGHGRK